MADYEVKEKPEFLATTRKLETTDRAHADLFNDLYQKLFNNDNYLKEDNDKKVNKKDGDITETQVSVIEESTESFPVPMSGDKTKGLWGKLKKWQQDCLAKFGNYVLTSMITNQHVNSTSNIPSSALVYLMQQGVTQLNRDIGVLNTKHEMNISSEILAYTTLSIDDAVKAWFASGLMPNGICLRLINHNAGVALMIAYKVSDYYGAAIYFGYGIDGIKLIRHAGGAWS